MKQNKGLICLSVFDGISCGRIALERAGIHVSAYYASEIDKYAEKISASNYPDIIRLGDITKWREWDIPQPDIILAGSPCQGFSFAGKGLNFNDPRSALFFVFADILRHYKPKYFLLENVKMKAEHQDVISGILGDIYPECVDQAEMFRTGRLEPVLINSALVSAQNRERLYWCNWKVTQPKDKGILLRDIIETDGLRCDTRNKGGKQLCRVDVKKSPCLLAREYKGVGNFTESAVVVTGVQKDNVCVMIGNAGLNGHESTNRVYSPEGKSPCLTAIQGGGQEPKVSTDSITWRKLTVTECERLQTVPDGFCRAVSKSRAYHALGNGWTVDVITHILKQMEIQK